LELPFVCAVLEDDFADGCAAAVIGVEAAEGVAVFDLEELALVVASRSAFFTIACAGAAAAGMLAAAASAGVT
jgi:hypothetical protein